MTRFVVSKRKGGEKWARHASFGNLEAADRVSYFLKVKGYKTKTMVIRSSASSSPGRHIARHPGVMKLRKGKRGKVRAEWRRKTLDIPISGPPLPRPAKSKRPRGEKHLRKDAGQRRISAAGIPYKVCARGMTVQSVLFPRDKWTPFRAAQWAKKHGFITSQLEPLGKGKYLRFRQHHPGLFERGGFRLFILSEKDGVKSVIGCPKRALKRGVRVSTKKTGSQPQRKAA